MKYSMLISISSSVNNPEISYRPLMLPAFLAFWEQQTGWTKANIVEDNFHEYTGRILTFASGELKFDVTMKEDVQILQFCKHIYADANPEYMALVKKIADAFETELAFGEY